MAEFKTFTESQERAIAIMARCRHDRRDVGQTMAAAARMAREDGKTRFVLPTAYGLAITTGRPQDFVRHYEVTPTGYRVNDAMA